MKLTPESVKQLKTLLQTAALVKIDKLIIEPGFVRGIDEAHSVVILSSNSIPDFGDAIVGLHRLTALNSRIGLFDSNEDFNVEAVEAPQRQGEDTTNISSLKLVSKGSKFEFRCARSDTIKAPRRINDEMVWSIKISKDAAKLVTSAANTMQSDQIAIVSKSSGEVLFEVVDGSSQDTFTTKVADSAEWIHDDEIENQSFVHYYSKGPFIDLLKAATAEEKKPKAKKTKGEEPPQEEPQPEETKEATIQVGRDGMAQITVNNHTFTLLPREE